MNDIHDNNSGPYQELGPTLPTLSEPPVDRRILNTVAELGARYRPLATADQEDHQTAVLLLARDLAAVDPAKLAAASNEWAHTERWMPKVCDLLALMQTRSRTDPSSAENLQRLVAKYNANPDTCRPGQRWVVVGTELKIERA